MSDAPGEDGRNEQAEDKKRPNEDSGSSKPTSEDSEEESSGYDPIFDGTEDSDIDLDEVDSTDRERVPSQEQPLAANALTELAEGESLTEVLKVALKEWREMQQISRERDEAQYKFQQSVIRIGALAFFGVVLVSGVLSYTGNLPGSSFAFILGTLFGSLATLLQSFLRNQQPD